MLVRSWLRIHACFVVSRYVGVPDAYVTVVEHRSICQYMLLRRCILNGKRLLLFNFKVLKDRKIVGSKTTVCVWHVAKRFLCVHKELRRPSS
jgi:hypothetical protein